MIPFKPILLSPYSGSEDVTVSPMLEWDSVVDATAYRLQVSKNDIFTDIIYDTSSILVPYREVTGLSYETRYWWRAGAVNVDGNSPWSTIWFLTTETYDAGKTYHIYESKDNGETWNLIASTPELSYELGFIPYEITDTIYKLVIEKSPLRSYGSITYPTFSFRRLLNILDNGYWDVDPNSNLYKIFEGIAKEAHCKSEIEVDYTELDSSILKIRSNRISDVYGKAFEQESSTVDEDYRRKIWDLFLGFRNTVTYEGVYHIVKAFTQIPPKIDKMSSEGWLVGIRYVGLDTIPLATLTALYGVFFKIHLFEKASGGVASIIDSTTVFDTTSNDYFNPVNGFYTHDFLIFKTGNNAYKSRKIMGYTYDTGTGIGRFTTQGFPFDTTSGDTFFVSGVGTDVIEDYVKKSTSLHSALIFKYYSTYITENHETGFAGELSNLELIPSHRIRIQNLTDTVDDGGRLVQAMYDSGNALTKSKPLPEFGGMGVVCWDDIEWGDAEVDFKMFITYSDDAEGTDWKFQEGRVKYITFDGIQEENLDEYIVEDSERVFDTLGNLYIKNVDYVMTYRAGTIRRTINSSISLSGFVGIEYDIVWGRVSQNQILSFNKTYFKYKFTVDNVRDVESWEFGGFYLKSLE